MTITLPPVGSRITWHTWCGPTSALVTLSGTDRYGCSSVHLLHDDGHTTFHFDRLPTGWRFREH